jgi:hypothetical protein
MPIVYSLQSLKEGAPSFCLACVGTDNTFTAMQVLKIWVYIHHELKRRGIEVINFASDGGLTFTLCNACNDEYDLTTHFKTEH